MFKHIFSSYSKFAFGNSKAGIGLFSAAAVAVSIPGNVVQSWSDSELKKKPSWYQETVHKLEHVVRKLRLLLFFVFNLFFSLYSYIEDPSLLDDASDILQRYYFFQNFSIFLNF